MVFWGLLCGLLGLALVPLFSAEVLPLQDAHLHEALAEVLHTIRTRPDHPWHAHFEIAPPTLRPNMLYYWLCHLLGFLMPVATAARLLVAVYVVALPLSLLFLFVTLGKSRWLVLLVIPFSYNAHMALGFINFMLATPLYFVAVALTVRLLARPTKGLALLLAAVALATMLAHAQLALLLLATMALLAAFQPTSRDARVLLATTALPALLVIAPWYAKYFIAEEQTAAGVRFLGLDLRYGAVWSSTEELLRDVPRHVNGYFASSADEILLIATCVLWLAGVATRRAEAPSARSHLLGIITIMMVMASILPPSHIANQFVIRERQILLAFLLLLGWFPWPTERRRHMTLAAIVAVGTVVWFCAVRDEFKEFDASQTSLMTLIDTLPPEATLGRVAGERGCPRMTFGASWYTHARAVGNRGALVPLWFASFPGTPVQYRPGGVLEDPGVDFVHDPRSSKFDFLLLKDPHNNLRRTLADDHAERFRKAAEEGLWLLLAVDGDDQS